MKPYFTVLFLLIFFTKVNSQISGKREKFTYWEIGFPDMEKAYTKEKVAKKHGFEFENMGCAPNIQMRRLIVKHNRKVDKKLTKLIGENWQDDVYKEIDSIYSRDTFLIHNFFHNFSSELNYLAETVSSPYDFYVFDTKDPNVLNIKGILLDKDRNLTDSVIFIVEVLLPVLSYKIVKE
jgi:hypothetical protein